MELTSTRVNISPNDVFYLRQENELVKLSYAKRTQFSYDEGQYFFKNEVVLTASLRDTDDSLMHYFINNVYLSICSTE